MSQSIQNHSAVLAKNLVIYLSNLWHVLYWQPMLD